MIMNEFTLTRMRENPNGSALSANLLPVPYVESKDVTNAVLWLTSSKARNVTGVTLPIDAGHTVM